MIPLLLAFLGVVLGALKLAGTITLSWWIILLIGVGFPLIGLFLVGGLLAFAIWAAKS